MDKKAKRKAFHTTRTLIIGIAAVCVLIGAMIYAWVTNGSQSAQGVKSITIQVIDNESRLRTYSHKTDAAYLLPALEELEGLTLEGTDSESGKIIHTVNGLRAGNELDGACWTVYRNGECCTYSPDSQPIADGDRFTIQYEPAK